MYGSPRSFGGQVLRSGLLARSSNSSRERILRRRWLRNSSLPSVRPSVYSHSRLGRFRTSLEASPFAFCLPRLHCTVRLLHIEAEQTLPKSPQQRSSDSDLVHHFKSFPVILLNAPLRFKIGAHVLKQSFFANKDYLFDFIPLRDLRVRTKILIFDSPVRQTQEAIIHRIDCTLDEASHKVSSVCH